LKRDLVNAIKKGGGSFKTVSDYSKILQRVGSRLAALNIQINSVRQIKVRHVELYMESRKNDGVANRTLQNEMTAIRRALDLSGKTIMADPKHERLSNKALGIDGGSRKG
ncbi:phage integrase N-terminal domain-containing protein, partial [Escherichia coli]